MLPAKHVLFDEPMSRHTSFRIGGPAAALVLAGNDYELTTVLRTVSETGAEHIIVGNGSNLLVADEGYPGIVIKLTGEYEMLMQNKYDPRIVRAGAAVLMSRTAAFLTERGLSGFEFASGIPGSIGGSVFMNAGAYGGEIKDVVSSVRVMDRDGSRVRTLSNEDMQFSYRHSKAEEGDMIILSAEMKLSMDDPAEIAKRVSELQGRRNAKQPVNYPSAGSTFKRPVGGYAAALIEQSGLKGYRVGGAEVSEKHSGFVINRGGASCEDVLGVMRHVREKVYEDSGITLEPEVRLINCSL
ncbi:MAG: UDP-N-acetylmuramate dehydrogenase [Mogibacterium sp.]|nr:UDP-N-acetylmuramate dehydrogenase [Mogibacterium sp.]